MCHSYSDSIAFDFNATVSKKVNEKAFHCLENAQILPYVAKLLFVKMKLILQSPIPPFAKKASHLLQLLGGGIWRFRVLFVPCRSVPHGWAVPNKENRRRTFLNFTVYTSVIEICCNLPTTERSFIRRENSFLTFTFPFPCQLTWR